jgi:nucleotide-binding universal stress UspA family protein
MEKMTITQTLRSANRTKRRSNAAGTILVPIDFSRGSMAALKHAVALSREGKGALLLVHVIPWAQPQYFRTLEKQAEAAFRRLAQRFNLNPGQCRTLVMSEADVARAIAESARKFRASMIVMGSHGRTGLQRLMLGSVAERTLRYTDCPVLVVRK